MDFRRVVRTLFLSLSTMAVAWGQNPLSPADEQASQNFGIDSINLQNLSLSIKVPVLAKPGAIPFAYSLYGTNSCQGTVINGTANTVCGFLNFYNSALDCENSWCLSLNDYATGGAWNMYPTTTTTGNVCGDGGVYDKFTNFVLMAPDGSTYYLPSTDYAQYEAPGHGTGACNHTFTDYTTSGGIKVTSDDRGHVANMIFPNGVTSTGAGLTDVFGNSITYNAGYYVDTLGVNPALSFTTQSGSTGEVDTYKDTGGTSHEIKQILTAETVKTTFGCAAYPDQTLSGKYAVTEVQYPDGINLYFSYEAITGGITGRIHQLTYRTGGTAIYTYGSMNCPSLIPSWVTRTTADGATSYTFAMNGTHGTTTTVLDPGKNKSVYYFQGTDSNGLPVQGTPLTLTEVQVFQNTGSVGTPSYTLLSTTIYCYNNNTTNCPTTKAAYPILHKDIYVAPGSKTTYSRTHYDYDTGCSGSCGLVTSVAEYASWVAIGAGTADNTTAITYGSWNSGTSSCGAVGSNIISLPCHVKTTDSASPPHTLSEALYTYTSKGFRTQAQNWTGSTWITTSASPNTNGTVASSTNALGKSTTYSYGDCNGMLPTNSTTLMAGGAYSLFTDTTWDCNGGKLMSFDDNNASFTYGYDLLFRPTSQRDNSNGYEVDESYLAPTVTQVTDSYVSTLLTVDGLGRRIRSQATDGSNYDTVTTSYGFNGTQFQTSLSEPCIVGINSDCTENHFLTVDPLGRGISSSTTNNETVNTSFNQNDVSVQLGPTPFKTTQTELDPLGRVTSICTLEGTGGNVCGQVDGNSGILNSVSYSYGVATSTVADTRESQTHTTTRDDLGRITSVSLPESGTTYYYYDTAACANSGPSSGNLTCSTDANGVTTVYFYDAINRLTDVNAVTASGDYCRRYRYDIATNGIQTAPTGYVGNNLGGRLMEAETDNCVPPLVAITDEWFAYDHEGRITDIWEMTPNSGGWYHTTATYATNGQLASLSGVPGQATYTITLDSNGRPNLSTLGTTTLVNGVTYNGAGQVKQFGYGTGSNNDAYEYDTNTGLMSSYTFTAGTKSMSGTLHWNANRTLNQLVVSDGWNAGGSQTCNFGYDDLGRLTTDNCGSVWTQTYTYDDYDNFSKSGSSNWTPGYQINNPSNNHIIGASYDSDGQLLYDLNNSYTWDGYHNMTSARAGNSFAVCGGTAGTCVTYNALGEPVEVNVGGTISEILYSPAGKAAVMNGSTVRRMYLPLPGGSTATIIGGTNYINHRDWLGNTRLQANLNGGSNLDSAYTPYGEIYATFGNSPQQSFTGLKQDLFAGLYDAEFREFDQSSGSRWLSPDPARASWNAYSYPTNPNSFVDPLGLDNCGTHDKGCKINGSQNAGGLTGAFFQDSSGIGIADFSLDEAFLSGQLSKIPVVGGSEFGPIWSGTIYAAGQLAPTVAQIDDNGNVSFVPDVQTLPIEDTEWNYNVQGWYNPVLGNGSGLLNRPAANSGPVIVEEPGNPGSNIDEQVANNNAKSLARAVNATGVQTLRNPCFVPGFYAASAVGPTIVAGAGISSEGAPVFPAFSDALASLGPSMATGTSWLSRAGRLGTKVVGYLAGAAADAVSSVCR